MNDRLTLLHALRDAGSTGLHSHDIRRAGISGNPAQRIIELRLDGHVIEGKVEWRNGRNGKRWTLLNDAERGGGSVQHAAASLGAKGHSRSGVSDSSPDQLFAPTEPAPRSAALHDHEEEAA